MARRTAERLHLYNREAELAILGSVLIDNAALALARGIVAADDFGDESLGNVFKAMLALADERVGIDALTLENKLAGRGGSPDAISAVIESIAQVPTATHVEHYAQIVADLAARRRLMQYSADVMQLATDETRPAAEVLGETAQKLQGVMRHDNSGVVAVGDAIHDYVSLVEDRMEHPGELWGVPTGLPDLDKLTNGLQPGLTVLSGITHHGKTALAVQIADHAASKGVGVLWFSLEMTLDQMVGRFACRRARINADSVQKGYLDADAMVRWYKGVSEIEQMPLYIADRASLDAGQLYAELVKARMRHDIGLVVIDHLHLMTPPKADRMDMALGQMASYIHQRGLEERLPMLTLAQLNRSVEHRDVKVPQPSDLRNSGEIEQAASVILMVHRPELVARQLQQDAPAEWRGMASVSVVKNRLSGQVGSFKVRFEQGWGEFQCLVKP